MSEQVYLHPYDRPRHLLSHSDKWEVHESPISEPLKAGDYYFAVSYTSHRLRWEWDCLEPEWDVFV